MADPSQAISFSQSKATYSNSERTEQKGTNVLLDSSKKATTQWGKVVGYITKVPKRLAQFAQSLIDEVFTAFMAAVILVIIVILSTVFNALNVMGKKAE